MVNKLVAARCKLDLQVKFGILECATPIYVAAVEGHLDVAKLLIAPRCNVDLQAKYGVTPLHVAIQHMA